MKQNHLRWVLWLFSLFSILGIGLLWSQHTRIEDIPLPRIAYWLIIWIAMFGLVFAFPKLNTKRSILLLAVATIAVRLSFWGAPESNDVNRYLWEGRLLWMGENPYETVADDEQWSHLRDRYWDEMNNRGSMTAYPPGMELVMAGASRVWYSLRSFKVIALIGDCWTLAILFLLSREFVKPVRWLGFYAFNPLILASFAVEAHFDSMMVASMLTALWMAYRGSWRWAWLWLGFAVQMKIMALLLAPLIFLFSQKESLLTLFSKPGSSCLKILQNTTRQIWPFFLLLILPSLVFLEHLMGMYEGLFAFGSDGAFNGGLYEFLRWIHLPQDPTRLIGLILFALSYGFVCLRTLKSEKEQLFDLAFWIFLALLITSPVVHFWYLSWALWFMVIRPSPALLTLCGTTAIYFLSWHNSESGLDWGYPRWIVVATWAPFFAIFFWENRFALSRLRQKRWHTPKTVALVIPVYKEKEERLKSFLSRLKEASPEANEIIIVEADPETKPPTIEGVRFTTSERGRGKQIAKGFAESNSDLIAVIHADTIPEHNWIPQILTATEKNPTASAFALGQRFDRATLGLWGIEVLNEQRATLGGSVFGDQTFIVRRQAIEDAGGFPDQPLMEDVEASWRLLEKGPIQYLGAEWTVSAKKWQRNFSKRVFLVFSLMIRYRKARRRGLAKAAELSHSLYQEYYPEKPKS